MGFDFHEAEHGHYFEDKYKLDTCHHMTEEGRVLRDMEREGVVYRYMHTCGTHGTLDRFLRDTYACLILVLLLVDYRIECLEDPSLCDHEIRVKKQPLPYRYQLLT